MTTADDIVIRPASAADRPALGRLGLLMVRAHFEFDPKRFLPPTDETESRYGGFLASQLDQKGIVLLVAEQNGEVVGYTYAGMEGFDYMSLRGPAGALYDIVVDPRHRGRGVGRRLLDATLAQLKERGAPRVLLSTATQNAAARHLFKAAGFRETMIEMTRES
jgi:ribosomal protein S18 acetylase RimI-like enzyme